MFDTRILESYTFYSSHLFSLWQRSVWFENNIISFLKYDTWNYKIEEFQKVSFERNYDKTGQTIAGISTQVYSDPHFGTAVIQWSLSILYFVL